MVLSTKPVDIRNDVKIREWPGSPHTAVLTDSNILLESQTSSLADVLQRKSPVFIRNYGTGLSMPSFRGMGASQTKIYWNGIPLSSPLRGVFDFGLIPMAAVDIATVDFGLSSLGSGAGGLGGGINLQTDTARSARDIIRLSLSKGSFGAEKGSLRLGYGKTKLFGSTIIYSEENKNHYSYTNTFKFDNPKEYQEKAAMKQYGFIQQIQWNASEKDVLTGLFWYQSTSRDIPPPLTTALNREKKNDSSTRIFLNYNHNFEKWLWQSKAAYTDENLHYTNLIAAINSRYKTRELFLKSDISQVRGAKSLKGAALQYISDASYSTGFKEPGPKKQDRLSGSAYWNYFLFSHYRIQAQLREEAINGKILKPAYSLTLRGQHGPHDELSWNITAGHNYNYPCLNDLYWNPGGNPKLKPEQAMQAEAGLAWEKKKHSKYIRTELTAYAMQVNDWILWQPGPAGYYEAQNLKKVNSKGMEAKIKTSTRLGKIKFSLESGYTYVHSVNALPTNPSDQSAGKQLAYTPMHNANGSLHLKYKGFLAGWETVYTGLRYVTTDNSSFLPPYILHNLILTLSLSKTRYAGSLQFRINNILNTEYQNIAWYTMPGRYIEVSLVLKLGRKIPVYKPDVIEGL